MTPSPSLDYSPTTALDRVGRRGRDLVQRLAGGAHGGKTVVTPHRLHCDIANRFNAHAGLKR